jgi:hypothetical protein
MNARFPSVKRIARELNLDTNTAKRVRGLMDGKVDPCTSEAVQSWICQCFNRPSRRELIMCAINEALDTCGVEAIEGEWIDNYHHNIQAVYCNTGDTYAATILLCHKRDRFMLTSWGDYVEHNRI